MIATIFFWRNLLRGNIYILPHHPALIVLQLLRPGSNVGEYLFGVGPNSLTYCAVLGGSRQHHQVGGQLRIEHGVHQDRLERGAGLDMFCRQIPLQHLSRHRTGHTASGAAFHVSSRGSGSGDNDIGQVLHQFSTRARQGIVAEQFFYGGRVAGEGDVLVAG
jgi:hypothetical protein